MRRHLKEKIITLFMSLTLMGSLFSVGVLAPVGAQNLKDEACSGLEITGVARGDCNNPQTGTSRFGGLVRNIITILSIVVGAASVIMLIIGGFRYIISSGDSNATASAKNTVLYAIVGLVIVLFAQVIVRFVLSRT